MTSGLEELARLFFKLGVIGFGGPAVHIAMMEDEVVRRRKWMDRQRFLDLVGATNLIPGPNSTEMAMHIGREREGWRGLVVAGLCFILPAVIITGFFSWSYDRYGQLPAVQPFIYGIKPAIIAVVAAVMVRLAHTAFKSILLIILSVLAFAAVLLGANEIVVLFAAGIAGMLFSYSSGNALSLGLLPFSLLQIVHAASQQIPAIRIFLIFLKVGSILYGSGYVLFAFLDAELVAKGLLTKQELIDAIAVGQFTPGPVFSSATFIGWQMGGWPAAIAATVGIFLPSFFFVALLNPLVSRLRNSKWMSAFLDSVNAASIAIILSVMAEMGWQVLHDWRTILIAVAGFIVSLLFKNLNSALVILGGAVVGYILSLF